MGLITLWASYNSGAEHMMILFCTYFAGRVLYIPCYLLALQPFRSAMYLLSQFSVIAAAIYGILAAGDDYKKVLPIACTFALFIMQLAIFHANGNKSAHPPEDDAYFGAVGYNDQGR